MYTKLIISTILPTECMAVGGTTLSLLDPKGHLIVYLGRQAV